MQIFLYSISSYLLNIFNDISFEKTFEENDYEQLDEYEKKLFDNLLTMCKGDKKIMFYYLNIKIFQIKKEMII